MPKKIPIILIFLFLLIANSCLAQRELEVTYPDIPGAIRPVSTRALLPETVVYFFNLAIVISGLIVFGALIYGGSRYLTSTGSPMAQSDARDQIFSSFLGLILLLSSYILLSTINPQLVRPGIAKEVITEGIVIFKDIASCNEFKNDLSKYDELARDGKALRITTSVAHLRNFLGENYDEQMGAIYFFEAGEDLEVYLFRNENWVNEVAGYQDQGVGECKNASGDTRSIKLVPKPAGVYLCCGGTYDGNWRCQGEERYLGDSVSSLPPECHDNVQGVKLKDAREYMTEYVVGTVLSYYEIECRLRGGWHVDLRNEAGKKNIYCFYKFATVLHNNANYKAECEVFMNGLQNLDGSNVIKYTSSSVTVFEPIREKLSFNGDVPIAPGEGVSLYPEVNYVTTTDVPDPYGPWKKIKASNTSDIGIADPEKVNCLKMAPDKRYIAVLFEDVNYGMRCEVFIMSDPDFVDNDIGKCGCGPFGWGCHSSVKSLIIYPTR